ncbi:DNA-3-methyladenine glycosylase I [Nibricoccus sp. IMCC34717]|uniref:DNA-3-methyladenine glycosylase I n=1 Tax=Nibricoccus sp. IMCC34717 TaxID=3034021 RepID=UPI00384B5DF8
MQPTRCLWPKSETDIRYHDEEWGRPSWDEARHLEFLVLEGAQAGLSWSTILNKRAGYRHAFVDYDPEKIARFTPARIEKLLKDPAIVRNRLKVESTVGNMRAYLKLREEGKTLAGILWSFVGDKPVDHQCQRHSDVPATTAQSDEAARFFKARGFKFFGSTIIYAHMQACGLFNDHLVSCHCHAACNTLAARRVK